MILNRRVTGGIGAPGFAFFGPFPAGVRVTAVVFSSPATTSVQADVSACKLGVVPQGLNDIAGGEQMLTGSVAQTGGTPCCRPTSQVFHRLPIDFVADDQFRYIGVQVGESGTDDTVGVEVDWGSLSVAPVDAVTISAPLAKPVVNKAFKESSRVPRVTSRLSAEMPAQSRPRGINNSPVPRPAR